MNRMYLKISLCFLIIGVFIFLGNRYLNRINFYNPVKINVVSNEKVLNEKITVIGVTPLGKQFNIPFDNRDTGYLFNDILLKIDTSETSKIHSILIYHGKDSFILNKQLLISQENEIILSKYNQHRDNIGGKLHAIEKVFIRYIIHKVNLNVYAFIFAFLFLSSCLIFSHFFASRDISQKILITSSLDSSKTLFYISLVFFLILQVYGVYFYQLRLQSDGSPSDLWNYSKNSYDIIKDAPYSRYAYILNKILIKLALHFHLPWTWVGRIYCLNDALFYLLIAVVIIRFTQKYEYATVVLAAPVLLHGHAFYTLLCCELFLSGALVILYYAVAGTTTTLKSYKRTFILMVSLFFIIWSHPIALIVLFLCFCFLYQSKESIIRDKWVLLFAFVNMVVRGGYLSEHDLDSIGRLTTTDKESLFLIGKMYLLMFWHMFILLIWVVYGLWKQKRYIMLGVLLCTGMICLYLHNIPNSWDTDFIKYMYPFHLLLLTESVILAVRCNNSVKQTYIYSFVVLVVNVYSIIDTNHRHYEERADRINKTIALAYAQDSLHSKWFLDKQSSVRNGVQDEGVTLIFSAFQNLPTAISIFSRNERDIQKVVDSVAYDKVMGGVPIDELNINYGKSKIYKGSYKKLEIDSWQ